jgi:hypothetical protein
MYFGFFQNFDQVFGIAQKSSWSCSFIAQIFFSELFNNHATTYQKLRKSLFIVFFFNLENHSKISTFSMILTFYLRHLDHCFQCFNLETFLFQVSNILAQKEF